MRVLLFLVPFVVYGGWLVLAGRRRAWVPRGPLPWIIAAAIGAVLVGLAFLGTRGAPPSARYVPPHMENGRIVPGHFDKAETP
ncbi:MAG TPA: DUF6111 family protein [Hyphomicrobiales bacterium]|nr:DUF6111 family protein [Hyphomicrobiales bacterium]